MLPFAGGKVNNSQPIMKIVFFSSLLCDGFDIFAQNISLFAMKTRFLPWAILPLLLIPLSTRAQVGPDVIIPRPLSVEVSPGEYVLSPDGSDIHFKVGERRFTRELSRMGLSPAQRNEAYRLTIGQFGVDIVAETSLGALRARQSLDYMRGISDTLAQCEILDYPRFAHRGAMLDVSRHFRDKDYILKQIDALSRVKISTLHLHLTDDAGWRVEIDAYPRLCSLAAWRQGENYFDWRAGGNKYLEQGAPDAYGGFLTKKDIGEIVEFAMARGIDVIPEVEMPGHSMELLSAYPEVACRDDNGNPVISSDVCPGSEDTYRILEGIIDEIIEMFPSKYIHIGGDEASKRSWKSCPVCRRKMEEMGFTEIDQLQSYLVGRMVSYIEGRGRRAIGWDEVMQGDGAGNATIMSWRGVEPGEKALSKGHEVIMAPSTYCYIDYYQDAPLYSPPAIGGYIPLRTIYSYDPAEGIDPSLQANLRGLQANLWAEFIQTASHNEYMLYPRILAIAENGWSSPGGKDYDAFRDRVVLFTDFLKGRGYNPFDIREEFGDRPESRIEVEHLARGCPVHYDKPYSRSYPSGGDTALTDGRQGEWGYKNSNWQGFNNDMDVTIDLGEVKPIHYVGAWFYSNWGNWITLPEKAEVLVSDDGVDFTLVAEGYGEIEEGRRATFYALYGYPVNVKARYVRFKGYLGDKPQHGFLFTDEIVVN